MAFIKKIKNHVYNRNYLNTNIYGNYDYLDSLGNKKISVLLKTDDSSFLIKYELIITDDIKEIKINILTGANKFSKGYIKELIVNKVINNPKSISIDINREYGTSESPSFTIENNTLDTLYPSTCLNNCWEKSNDFNGVFYRLDITL